MNSSNSKSDNAATQHEARKPEPSQGFEGSAERDAQSHQVIGEHGREVERQIGEQMPDRK